MSTRAWPQWQVRAWVFGCLAVWRVASGVVPWAVSRVVPRLPSRLMWRVMWGLGRRDALEVSKRRLAWWACLMCVGHAAYALPLGLEGPGADVRKGAGMAPTSRDQARFDRPMGPASAAAAESIPSPASGAIPGSTLSSSSGSSPRKALSMPGMPGLASVYHRRLHGRPTASGEPYVNDGWTAAHRELPLGTLLSVFNPANGVEVVVRVNDRGPFHPGRMVDLSVAAAQALDLMKAGVAMVVIRPLLSDEADSRSLGVQTTAAGWRNDWREGRGEGGGEGGGVGSGEGRGGVRGTERNPRAR